MSVSEPSGNMDTTMIFAYFEEEWAEVIQSLSVDQEVIILGCIEDIDTLSVDLVSCSVAKGLAD